MKEPFSLDEISNEQYPFDLFPEIDAPMTTRCNGANARVEQAYQSISQNNPRLIDITVGRYRQQSLQAPAGKNAVDRPMYGRLVNDSGFLAVRLQAAANP